MNIAYHVLLAPAEEKSDTDGAQAFGSSFFQSGDHCLLLLSDWCRKGYAFSLEDGLISQLDAPCLNTLFNIVWATAYLQEEESLGNSSLQSRSSHVSDGHVNAC
jgi:hypothetical protein